MRFSAAAPNASRLPFPPARAAVMSTCPPGSAALSYREAGSIRFTPTTCSCSLEKYVHLQAVLGPEGAILPWHQVHAAAKQFAHDGRALAAARGSPSSPSEICLDGQSKCVFAAVSGATPVSSPMWFERPTLRFSCRSPPGQDGDRHGVAASAWHPRLSSTGSRAVTPNKEGRRSLLTSLRGISLSNAASCATLAA